MLSNAYFLAKLHLDTAENEPAKNLQKFANFATFANPNPQQQRSGDASGPAACVSRSAPRFPSSSAESPPPSFPLDADDERESADDQGRLDATDRDLRLDLGTPVLRAKKVAR